MSELTAVNPQQEIKENDAKNNMLPKVQIYHSVINELRVTRTKGKVSTVDFGASGLQDTTLDSNEPLVINLVHQVSSLVSGKSSRVYHGSFIEKKSIPKNFPTQFDDLYKLSEDSLNPIFIDITSFINFSKAIMNKLKNSVGGKTILEHSYILCADFSINKYFIDKEDRETHNYNRYFLIAMLKISEKIQLDSQLIPKKVEVLELNNLHQAVQIDFNRYVNLFNQEITLGQTENQTELDIAIIERPIYLSFVSPQSNSVTTGYFSDAFSYTQGVTPKKAVELLHTTIINAFRTNDKLKHHSTINKLEKCLYKFYTFFRGKTVKLDDIRNVIIQAIPSKLSDQSKKIANEIINNLNSMDVGVPSEFKLSPQAADIYRKINFKNDLVTLEIDAVHFGVNPNSTIYFDEKNNKIEIKLNHDDKDKLKKELNRLGI